MWCWLEPGWKGGPVAHLRIPGGCGVVGPRLRGVRLSSACVPLAKPRAEHSACAALPDRARDTVTDETVALKKVRMDNEKEGT